MFLYKNTVIYPAILSIDLEKGSTLVPDSSILPNDKRKQNAKPVW